MKKRNVILTWVFILFLTVVILEIVYTPYDYAGFLPANNVGEGVAQADYPPISGMYQVVYVTAEQWQFLFYPHVVGSPAVTVVYANMPVLFIVRSVDVVHGFYVNTEGNFVSQGFQFGVMAIPGYFDYVTWNFQPTAAAFTGPFALYHVFCSEYCGTTASGLGHSWMDALIQVVPQTANGTAFITQALGGNLPIMINGTHSVGV